MTEQCDAVEFEQFVQAITPLFSEQNRLSSYLQRYAYGTDASFYRLVPKLVLRVDTLTQLQEVIQQASQWNIAITFRAAGTSLSGQAITNSVLILLSPRWRNIEVLDNGHKVRLQPGVIGARANQILLPYRRKIGPDPASINSCKVGGIAANNSSGMCCGVSQNSYHTLADIRLLFADGSELDTASQSSRQQFVEQHAQMIGELTSMVNKLKKSPQLVEKIQRKYRLKNTTGYGINALLEFDDPIDIISHLMIGSEGTLGFIADITYHTIALPAFKATGLFVFDDIGIACHLVHQLADYPVAAVEIMDARALNSVRNKLEQIVAIPEITDNSAALLIELGADTQEQFERLQNELNAVMNTLQSRLLGSQPFSADPLLSEAIWQIRKGMFPAVGAVRKTGTTVIIEDVAMPLEKLADGVMRLHQLFTQFGYDEAIIFGHALAGNLHFVFTQAFDSKEQVARYEQLMAAVSELIAVEYQGSLKAEHGTGRNMAPFVELEWGSDIYQLMRDIKQLFDPQGILNPGVIINDDPLAHLSDLKEMPAANEQIDQCIECGFCESVCPSQELTLTPRQRITLWRRINQLQSLSASRPLSPDEQQQLTQLNRDYQYFGIDSCAATGLCAQQCPVEIDTGEFIKSLRRQQIHGQRIAGVAARHFAGATQIARFGLSSVRQMNKLLGNEQTQKSFKWLNKLSGNRIPLWNGWPGGATTAKLQQHTEPHKVVYITSCANRVFAADPEATDQRPIQQVMESVLHKAGIQMLVSPIEKNLCCGMPWASKGHKDIAESKKQQFIQEIQRLSDNGRWPVVTDASPCALSLNDKEAIPVMELSEYLVRFVLDRLAIEASAEPVLLHKTCSSLKMNKGVYLEQLVRQCSNNVSIPDDIHCCGFAGDKGFFMPELNASALHSLHQQVPTGCQRGISNSRTCEIGLSHHAGIPYQSVLYLLDEVSRNNPNSG